MSSQPTMERAHQQLGIVDMQLYFPKYYVDQSDLEDHDKAAKGKYTIGLGQEKMAFVKDNEDINSISLTVVDKIIKRNNLSLKDISRLEVGTETFLDKSKSIKTHLMELFRESGNFDIEGISTTNACYGGTNALLNAFNWLYSDFYDGKYAIVVSADIAIYSKGPARPTGGCGAIAILLGPYAKIEIENIRSTYMNNVYDFYKPDPVSEYPTVDGVFSIDCYFKALEYCYSKFLEKHLNYNKSGFSLNNYDYFCFHSPFGKMVEKAFYQLVSYDFSLNNKTIKAAFCAKEAPNCCYMGLCPKNEAIKEPFENLIELFSKRKHDFKLDNKFFTEVKKVFQNSFKNSVEPGLLLGKNLGNIYTGSLYLGLISLILNEKIDLANKKVMMFSYGSGCAATLFSFKFHSKNLGDYKDIRKTNFDVLDNLKARIKVSPLDYEQILAKKEKMYLTNNYVPEANKSLEDLVDGTYYLDKVDDKWRRTYSKKVLSTDKKISLSFNKLGNYNETVNGPIFNKSLARIMLIRNQLADGQ
jgi:hydroxymethylglutaryl-CoA synthase